MKNAKKIKILAEKKEAWGSLMPFQILDSALLDLWREVYVPIKVLAEGNRKKVPNILLETYKGDERMARRAQIVACSQRFYDMLSAMWDLLKDQNPACLTLPHRQIRSLVADLLNTGVRVTMRDRHEGPDTKALKFLQRATQSVVILRDLLVLSGKTQRVSLLKLPKQKPAAAESSQEVLDETAAVAQP